MEGPLAGTTLLNLSAPLIDEDVSRFWSRNDRDGLELMLELC